MAELERIKREEAGRVLFIRYEDLILDRERTLARLAEYLEIEPFSLPAEAHEQAGFKVHGTSSSPEASIGRWKTDLPTELHAWYDANRPALLSEFGYQ
jgi:hypothetical protein